MLLLPLYFRTVNARMAQHALRCGIETSITEELQNGMVEMSITPLGNGEIHVRSFREVTVRRGDKTHIRRLKNPRQTIATIWMEGKALFLTDESGQTFKEEDGVVQHVNPTVPVTTLQSPLGSGMVFIKGNHDVNRFINMVLWGNPFTPTEVEKSLLCGEHQPAIQPFPYGDKLHHLGDIGETIRHQLTIGYSHRMVVYHDGKIAHQVSGSLGDDGVVAVLGTLSGTGFWSMITMKSGWFGAKDRIDASYQVEERTVDFTVTGSRESFLHAMETRLKDLSNIMPFVGKFVTAVFPYGVRHYRDGRDITNVVLEYLGERVSLSPEEAMLLALVS